MKCLGGFGEFSRANAAGTKRNGLRRFLLDDPNGLQIRQPASTCTIVGVGNFVSVNGFLFTKITAAGHIKSPLKRGAITIIWAGKNQPKSYNLFRSTESESPVKWATCRPAMISPSRPSPGKTMSPARNVFRRGVSGATPEIPNIGCASE